MDAFTKIHSPNGMIISALRIVKIMAGGHAYRDVWMKMQPTSMQRQLFNPKTTMETFYVSMRHARRHHMMGVFTSNHSARIAKVLAMNPVQALVE
jgi:hypothetical protein